MKINHLLISLASLSLAVISARAASLENNTACVTLPAYDVVVPRQTAVERDVARSLAEFRAAARTPIAVKTEIPLVNARPEASRQEVKPVLVVARN